MRGKELDQVGERGRKKKEREHAHNYVKKYEILIQHSIK